MIVNVREVVIALALIGCGKPHVTINAPPPNLTPEQRVQQFQELRQGGEGAEIVTSCSRGACSSTRTDLLILRNGTEIRYAEDLLPVLPADSPAAIAARQAEASRQKSKRLNRLGWLMFVGGFTASMIGFAKENDLVMYAGLGTTLGGLLVVGYVAVSVNREVSTHTRVVFDNYDQSLAKRLDVCVNGLAVVPCEATGGLPPPASEPDPALKELRQK